MQVGGYQLRPGQAGYGGGGNQLNSPAGNPARIPPGTLGNPIPVSHQAYPDHNAWLRQQQQLYGQMPLQQQQIPRSPALRLNPELQQAPQSPLSARPLSAVPRGFAYPPNLPPSPPNYNSRPPQIPPQAVSTPLGRPRTGSSHGSLNGQRPQTNGTALAANLAQLGAGPITATSSAVGPALLKLNALNESMTMAFQREDVEDLRAVVKEYFTDAGIVKYGLYDTATSQSKTFEIPASALPRFQHINLISGVTTTSINPSFVREFQLTTPSPATGQPIHVGFLLKAEKTSWMSHFDTGVYVELRGALTVHFVVVEIFSASDRSGLSSAGLKVESMQFSSRGHEEYIARNVVITDKVERLFEHTTIPAENSLDLTDSPTIPHQPPPTGTSKGRPVRRTTGGRKKSNSKEEIVVEEKEDVPIGGLGTERSSNIEGVEYERNVLPPSPVGSFGITEMGMRCLEIAESVAQLQDLIGFSLDTNTGPIESLSHFAELRHRQLALAAAPVSSNVLQNLPSAQQLEMFNQQQFQMQQLQQQQAYQQQQQQQQQLQQRQNQLDQQHYQQIPLPSPALAGQIGSTSQNAATNSFYSSNPSPAVSVASLPQRTDHDLSNLADPVTNPHQIPPGHPMHQTLTLNGAALNSKKRKIAASPNPFGSNSVPPLSNGDSLASVSTGGGSNLGTIPRTPTPDELTMSIHGAKNGSAGINSTPGGSMTMDMNGGPLGELRIGGRARTRGGRG